MSNNAARKAHMQTVINACPGHLYTYTPQPGDTRYVFTDKVCRFLNEAYEHATGLAEKSMAGKAEG